MSGFLKQKRIILVSTFILLALFIILFVNEIIGFIFLLFVVLCLIIVKINKMVIIKLNRQLAPFKPDGNMRNIECLIIGDMIKLPNNLECISKKHIIEAPGRSLSASFEILRHTHSILKNDKNSNIVIVVKDKNITKQQYSIFDVHFFHSITIKVKKLNSLKRKSNFPLLFSPIKSVMFLMGYRKNKYNICDDLNNEINEFCRERGYIVHYYIC